MSKKEITIYDLAEKLGLSAATVSRALKDHPAINSETKKKVFALAKKMGYRTNKFASNLRKQKTNTIGVIVPRLNSPFMSSVLSGIEKTANNKGYNIIISQSLESEAKERSNVFTHFNNRVDALIVSLSYETDNMDHFQSFINKEIPLVFFDRVPESINATKVVIDNFRAGYEATLHLIEQGYKDIVHITGNIKRNVYKDRFEGYKRVLTDHNILYREDNFICNDLSEDAIYNCIHNQILTRKKLPDALFITNDTSAAFALSILKENGIKIPSKMAIIGFNNDLISKVTEPNITTINYPGYQMGETVARIAIEKIDNKSEKDVTSTVILNAELVVRGSTVKR